MGIGRKTPKPRAAGTRAFGSGKRVSGKDAEAYAQGKKKSQTPFARGKRGKR